MAKRCTRITFKSVKPGDKVIFNDGREKMTVTIKKWNATQGDWDAEAKGKKTFLGKSDFSKGHIFKCKTVKK